MESQRDRARTPTHHRSNFSLMGRKLQISLVVIVLVAISGAFLVYFWDKSYKDEIAEGVTIGGVQVGGLDADAAAAQLRANLVTPLDKDVVVRYGDEKYKLDADELDVEHRRQPHGRRGARRVPGRRHPLAHLAPAQRRGGRPPDRAEDQVRRGRRQRLHRRASRRTSTRSPRTRASSRRRRRSSRFPPSPGSSVDDRTSSASPSRRRSRARPSARSRPTSRRSSPR